MVKNILGLFGWLILCFSASFIGALGSMNAPTFYGHLDQPSWAPEPWLFGPVWTVLYTMMAISVWQIWRKGTLSENKWPLFVFIIQLILNALWSWVFFAWQLGGLAFAEIVLLGGGIVLTMSVFWKKDCIASILLLPYLLWVCFAALLNFTLWQMNPTIL